MFEKILIANRGEIACRIIKTAKHLGIKTVAIYSSVDANSLHVKSADEAYCVGEAPASQSYLNIEAIINIALKSKAEAIHPGYGFLSENPDFARACEKNNIVFVGPSVEALEIMGSKQRAKELLAKSSIPLTPGYHGKNQSDEELLKQAIKIGFPILIKAANGGGGKGMRSVFKESDFLPELASARREALASFADDTMLLEKLLEQPRHIEMQIMGDNFGTIVHLFERDCSMQRRHQKIIEEAPAPLLSADLRNSIAKAAITIAKKINYRGAGTVEFLLDKNNNFYFMEMNTRLQVEHPVTEMITGLDLVEWQLRIAANEPLPCKQKDIKAKGHAIECRIYAEDPQNHFLPSIGLIHYLQEPAAIRIDTGISQGDTITQYYDPMIAKLIAYGNTREEAVSQLKNALTQYYIGGVKTNIQFLRGIINFDDFQKAKISTNFLEKHRIIYPKIDILQILTIAASFDTLNLCKKQNLTPFAWQMNLNRTNNLLAKRHWVKHYLIDQKRYDVTIIPIDDMCFTLLYEDHKIVVSASLKDNKLKVEYAGANHQVYVEEFLHKLFIYTENGNAVVQTYRFEQSAAMNTQQKLTAPMPGTIVAILKKQGEKVKAGERLIILEAMKMEHTLYAPYNGIIKELFYQEGTQVNEGVQLARIDET